MITFVAVAIGFSNQQTVPTTGQTESKINNVFNSVLFKIFSMNGHADADTPGWVIPMIVVPWVLFTLNTTCILVYIVFKGE